MQVYALNCGNVALDFKRMIRDKKGRVTVPVPAWLIIHPKGKVLFDSGFHMDTSNPENGRIGWLSSAWSKSHEIIAHRKISQEIF